MLPSISAEPGLQDHAGNFVGEDQAMIWFEHPTVCVIGSTAAIIQRELFGQEHLQNTFGPTEAHSIEKRVEYLEHTLMPLDRCQKMMVRALDRLNNGKGRTTSPTVAIGQAGQVNVNGSVSNTIEIARSNN